LKAALSAAFFVTFKVPKPKSMQPQNWSRHQLAVLISEKIKNQKNRLSVQFEQSKESIGYFIVDELMPSEIAIAIHNAFPKKKNMKLNKSIREWKYIGVQMNLYNPLLEEVIYAFQLPEVVNQIQDICNIKKLKADPNLYAGGISTMTKDQFLNPHLDNSHDKDRKNWRVLNLLYYVNPKWKESDGGHLEIWPKGILGKPLTIHAKFNRLVVMATHNHSWHSVCKVMTDSSRNCISNYYFSSTPLNNGDKFHVTTFRGWPHQKIKNQVLRLDSTLRMGIRKIFRKGITENPHVYKKNNT